MPVDLNQIEAAQSVKLIAADSAGAEIAPYTSSAIGSKVGLDSAPIKHAPNTRVTGVLGSLNAAVTVSDLDGFGTAGVALSGTWAGTVSFLGSVDGTTFVAMNAQPLGSGLLTSSATANGVWRLNITGLKAIQVKMTGYTSGSAAVAVELTPHAGPTQVDAIVTVVPAPSTFATIYRRQEITVATKTETDLPSGAYTVPPGKMFVLASFQANYDTQSPLVVRLKKQTGGAGAFVTEFRLTLKQHGQDNSNVQFTFPYGIQLGTAGDVIKITYESALSKGTLWSSFTGVEY
jgi:hypothetical protein